MNRRWYLLAILAGISLLAVVLLRTDLGEVGQALQRLQAAEIAVLLFVYFCGRLLGVVSWLLTLRAIPLTPLWLVRLWRVHLVGGAVERVTPLAGLGGDPAKAVLMNRDYGTGLRDVTASLVLTRMTDLLAILVFCGVGTGLLAMSSQIPAELRRTAVLSLSVCGVLTTAFFVAQQARMVSRCLPWLERHWPQRFEASRSDTLRAMLDVEVQLAGFYRQHPGRFALSVLATVAEWICETAVVWLTLTFLDLPISVTQAICIEAFTLLIRSTLFFVPGDVGTQEAALVLMCRAVVGVPAVGLVIAAVVRGGELLLVAVGFALGARSLSSLRKLGG